MATVGIVLDLRTIQRLRSDFRKLEEDLERQLRATDEKIETVSRTWRDDNFRNFKNKFDQDKERLRPLSKKVSDFEKLFLTEIEHKLKKYYNRG